MPAVLAVDLGKTSCRAALWLDDDRFGPDANTAANRTASDIGAPGLATRDGAELAERAIRSIYRQLLEDLDPPDELTVCVGAAGGLASPSGVRTLAGRLSALFPTGAIAVCSDAVIAHAGALGGEPGLVLAIGTGSVVLGIEPAHGLIRIDGWGPLLGDLGSGGWIGTTGLRAALRSFDGRGPATDLEQAAATAYGDLSALPARFADRSDAARLAAGFAPTVAASAAANDLVSRQIMDEAAAHLAETVAAGWRRLHAIGDPQVADGGPAGGIDPHTANAGPAPSTDPGRLRLAVTGGLTELGQPLLEPLTVALAIAVPGLTLQVSTGTPLEGGYRLAVDRTTAHEPYLYRTVGNSNNASLSTPMTPSSTTGGSHRADGDGPPRQPATANRRSG